MDRLVDLAEEFMIEAILLELDDNRVPKYGADQQAKVMAFVDQLAKEAEYRSSIQWRFKQIPYL
jgi:hypothetical protein